MLALALTGAGAGTVACRDSGAPRTGQAPPAGEDVRATLEPLARIGDGEGRPGHELFRAFTAALLDDGRIAVGNAGTGEVRFYDARGELQTVAGREGAGPGEFRSINWIGTIRGDSILVYDMAMHRFSVLDPEGGFVRTFSPPSDVGTGRPLGVAPGDLLVVSSDRSFDPRSAQGIIRDTVRLTSLTLTGERLAALGTLPGSDWLSYRLPDAFAVARVPFGRAALVGTVGDRVIQAGSTSDRISLRPLGGGAELEFQVPAEARSLTQAEIADALEAQVRDPVAKSALQDHFRRQGLRAAPLLADLSAGGDGTFWVKLSPAAGAATARWLRYSGEGHLLADVSLAETARLLDSAGDVLAVREQNEDGTEQVAMYRLRR